MHAHVVIWTRTGFVMATIVEIIRARMSAVPGRNHIVTAYRAFDKMTERQEVFAVRGFLILVAGRLN